MYYKINKQWNVIIFVGFPLIVGAGSQITSPYILYK